MAAAGLVSMPMTNRGRNEGGCEHCALSGYRTNYPRWARNSGEVACAASTLGEGHVKDQFSNFQRGLVMTFTAKSYG